jgi:hypothetical protein
MKKIMIILASLSILLVGCGKPSNISTDTSKISFAYTGGVSAIVVTADAAWTATSSDVSVIVLPASGDAGSAGVTITAAPNTGTADINAVVTFTCDKNTASVDVVIKAIAPQVTSIIGSYNASGLDAWELYLSSDANNHYTWTEDITGGTESNTADLNYWARTYGYPKLNIIYEDGAYKFKEDIINRGRITIGGVSLPFFQQAFAVVVDPIDPNVATAYYPIGGIEFDYLNGTLSADFTINLTLSNGTEIPNCLVAIGSVYGNDVNNLELNDLVACPVFSKGSVASKAPRYNKGTYKVSSKNLNKPVKAIKLK